MKKPLLTIATIAAAISLLNAGTYTWTGAAGDGEFFTPENWLVDGSTVPETVSNELNDDFMISGASVVVNYASGHGDMLLNTGKTLTITGGAKLLQTHGAWPMIKGNLFLDNGTYEITEGVTFRVDGGAVIMTKTGTLSLAGLFTPTADGDYSVGNYVLGGELQPADGAQLSGANWTCSRITPANNATVDFSAGSITVTNPDYNGFYQHGTAHLNVTEGAKVTLTLAIPEADEITEDLAWSKTFGSTRFTYNGAALADKAAFLELFTWRDNGDHTLTVRAKAADIEGSGMTLGDVSATLDGTVATTVTISATIDAVGSSELSGMTLAYGTDRTVLDQETAFELPSLVQDGATLTKTLSGLELNRRYYYRVTLTNVDEESDRSQLGHFDTFIPTADRFLWTGAESNDSDRPGNWYGGAVPGANDDVEIVDTLAAVRDSARTIVWTLSAVKSVTHRSFAGNDVLVKFRTSKESPLVVSGDVTLDHAIWMVDGANDSWAGQTPPYSMNIEIGGNLIVDADSIVHAGRDYNLAAGRSSGYYRAGPGYFEVGDMFEPSEEFPTFTQEARFALHKLYGRGASFGGDGGYRAEIFPGGAPAFTSYGAILNPAEWGSSGEGDGPAFAGGGLIRLVVGGATTLNGRLEAVGFGYPNFVAGNSVGASSGGTINLTTASLAGSGTINADGGCDEEGGNGSGGRVRVKLTSAAATFNDFNVANITAMGGTRRDGNYHAPIEGVVDAAAGTIALQTATDNESSGTVVIKNRIRKIDNVDVPVGATHFPSMQAGDRRLSGVKLVVEADTFVKLTRNVAVKEMTFEGDNIRRGAYTAAQLNETVGKDRFSGDGVLTVGGTGFALIIR